MIEVLSTKIPGRIAFYRSILEEAGVQTFVRNENVSGAEGMIPIFEPALCVVVDGEAARAIELIKQAKLDEDPGSEPNIKCANCVEESPSNFAICWNCGAELVKED